MPEQFWIEHRQYYRSMCDLCKSVDDAISKITIVSFANNLYFVCVQLLRSLKYTSYITLSIAVTICLCFTVECPRFFMQPTSGSRSSS